MGTAIPQRNVLHPAGFSLLELTVILVILAIVAGLAIPRWLRASQHYACDLAAQRIASDISMAQSLANYRSASVSISFNTITSGYQIQAAQDLNHSGQSYAVDLTAKPYNATLGTVSFGTGSTVLSFDGYGTPAQGGNLSVKVADRMHTLTVDPSSGKVTIQ